MLKVFFQTKMGLTRFMWSCWTFLEPLLSEPPLRPSLDLPSKPPLKPALNPAAGNLATVCNTPPQLFTLSCMCLATRAPCDKPPFKTSSETSAKTTFNFFSKPVVNILENLAQKRLWTLLWNPLWFLKERLQGISPLVLTVWEVFKGSSTVSNGVGGVWKCFKRLFWMGFEVFETGGGWSCVQRRLWTVLQWLCFFER